MSGNSLCIWHITGVPTKVSGTPFYNKGCPTCEAKALKDPTLLSAPSSLELWKQYKAKPKTLIDWRKVNKNKLKEHLEHMTPREWAY